MKPLLSLSLSVLLVLSSCSSKSAQPVTKMGPIIEPSTLAVEPSPVPSPEPSSAGLSACEGTVVESVDILFAQSEEALVRYEVSKRVPSRNNFKAAYAAFLIAKNHLKLLDEEYPAHRCVVALSLAGEVRLIETAHVIEAVRIRIDSPTAFIEENRLN